LAINSDGSNMTKIVVYDGTDQYVLSRPQVERITGIV